MKYYARKLNGKKVDFAITCEYSGVNKIFFIAFTKNIITWDEIKDYFVARRMKIYNENDEYIPFDKFEELLSD